MNEGKPFQKFSKMIELFKFLLEIMVFTKLKLHTYNGCLQKTLSGPKINNIVKFVKLLIS